MAGRGGGRSVSDDREDWAARREADAEAVRAYLVVTRGGAPLLSSTDAHLLYDWLEAGVRVGVMVRAIDLTAQKRLAKKVRAPLSLASCRAEVERLRRGGRWRAVFAAAAAERAIEREVSVVNPAVEASYEEALSRITRLDGQDVETKCERALAIGREFFEAAWAALDQGHAMAEAGESLADHRAAFSDAEWVEACEAVARDHLRRRYPRLTATSIWTEFGLGLA